MTDRTTALYQAALGAFACFVFPDNDEQRGYTVLAFANIGRDYIEDLFEVVQDTTDHDIELARFKLAAHHLVIANAHYTAHRAANPPKEPHA